MVALDPLFRKTNASEHQLSLGRLCVTASRHMTHLTWVYAENRKDILATAHEESDDVIVGSQVRRSLIGGYLRQRFLVRVTSSEPELQLAPTCCAL